MLWETPQRERPDRRVDRRDRRPCPQGLPRSLALPNNGAHNPRRRQKRWPRESTTRRPPLRSHPAEELPLALPPPSILMARRSDRLAAGLVATTAAVLAVPFVAGITMLDEGTMVHVADRLASGEVLYRDVATGVMPGAYYLLALIFSIFGRSLLVGRVVMIFLFALTSAAIFLMARGVTCRSVAVATALTFCALSVNYWRFFGYSPLAIVLVVLTIAASRAFLDTGRRRWLLLAALGIGLTILVKQNYGALVALGVAGGLAARPASWRRRLRDVATTAVTAAIPLGVTLALFAVAGAASDLWHFTVEVPLELPSSLFVRPLPPLWGEPDARLLRDIVYYLPFEELWLEVSSWLQQHPWITLTAVRVTYYLPALFLGLASVVWTRRRRGLGRAAPRDSAGSARVAEGALYLSVSSFLLLGAFPRVDGHHWFMVLAPSFVLAAWALGPSPGRAVRRGAAVVAGVAVTLSLASQIASIADLHPQHVRDYFLKNPRAHVWVARWQGAEIERHLREIETRVPEGEPIFVAPAEPMYYFLSNRRNPSRYPLILPGALDEEEVVRALEVEPVRYALLSDIGFEEFPFQLVAPRVWEYVRRHFVPVEGAGWGVAPFAPYLYQRGRKEEPAYVDRITMTGERGERTEHPVTVRDETSLWAETAKLVEPPYSPTPEYQTASLDDWSKGRSELAQWQSAYLEPSLVMRAPGGWRKVMASWEVPVDQGQVFDFSCALTAWAWAGWTEGQGALVEVWVGPSPATSTSPPRRVWMRWLNPRLRNEDRRWRRAVVDLGSFVDTPNAVVTLVTGAAPTFIATDATVAWSGLRLLVPRAESSAGDPSRGARPRNLRLDERTTRLLLSFQEEDLGVFEAAAREYPELPEAQSALAEVAASLGRHPVALAASEKAARLEPSNSHYWMRLGQELQTAGRMTEAIETMRKAIEQEPDNPDYHAALGAALLEDPQRHQQARDAVSTAVRLDPTNTWAWTLLSVLDRRAGNYPSALKAAERAVELAPDQAWPNLTLADSLTAMGFTSEVEKVLNKTASLDMDAGARSALARNLLAFGRVERAREQAREATEQDPGSFASWVVLAQVEAASQRWEPAVQAWRQAIARDPSSSSARVQLASALARLGRRDESRRTLIEAKAVVGESASGLREIAIVMDEIDGREEANAVWRRVLMLAPEGEVKEEARRRLAREPAPVEPIGSHR